MSSEYIGAWATSTSRVVPLRGPTHVCVKLLPVAPRALLEEHMAQWDTRSLALYILEVQEAGKWDLRSLYSHFPFVVAVVFLILVLVPTVQLLRRTGHHPVWSILVLFPVLNLVALWFFAFKQWPTDKQTANIGN